MAAVLIPPWLIWIRKIPLSNFFAVLIVDAHNDLLVNKQDGRIKLFLIYSLLQARKEMPDFFQNASYIPLEAEGAYKNNIIAFAMKYNDNCIIFAASRFFTSLVKEGVLPLGDQVWAGTNIIIPEKLPVGKIFEYLPVCFLKNSLL